MNKILRVILIHFKGLLKSLLKGLLKALPKVLLKALLNFLIKVLLKVLHKVLIKGILKGLNNNRWMRSQVAGSLILKLKGLIYNEAFDGENYILLLRWVSTHHFRSFLQQEEERETSYAPL